MSRAGYVCEAHERAEEGRAGRVSMCVKTGLDSTETE